MYQSISKLAGIAATTALILTTPQALSQTSQRKIDELEAGFLHPTHASRPHTWWHWMNGNISREGITKDLQAMAEIGLGGANIFNVSCDIPEGPVKYMSAEWLELVTHAAREAKRFELELGIHNCAGWATSGGPWIEPKDAMQMIYFSEIDVQGGQIVEIKLPRPEVEPKHFVGNPETLKPHYWDIAILAFPKNEGKRITRYTTKTLQSTARSGMQPKLDSATRQPDRANTLTGSIIQFDSVIDITSNMKADGTLNWEAPPGEWTILRMGHGPSGMSNHPAPLSGTGLDVDKMSRTGVDAHWKSGIQPMLDHLGPLAGSTLTTLIIDSYEAGNHAWTPNMREEFKKRRGYEMGAYLVTLSGRCVGNASDTERFYHDFRRTIGDLVTDNYYAYMAELCHRHGLKIAIEPYRGPFESMTVAMQADIPTGEFWADLGYGVPFLKLASSAANLKDLPITAAEAFTAVGGWENHPAVMKYSGDLAWTHGVNRLVFHRFAHQPWDDLEPGMTMGRYGMHFERTNTWWQQGKAWVDYITRAQSLLQRGKTVADVLCFAGEWIPNTCPDHDDLRDDGYDYDVCGTDVFRQLRVEDGMIVTPNGRRYQLLQVGPFSSPILSLEVTRKLGELANSGGKILAQKPADTPSLSGYPSSGESLGKLAKEMWANSDEKTATPTRYGKGLVFQGRSATPVLQQLRIAPDVSTADNQSPVAWIHRQTPKADIYFIANKSRTPQDYRIRFRTTGRVPELWDPLAGSITPAAAWRIHGELTEVPVSLQADGSMFVVFRRTGTPPSNPVMQVSAESKKISQQLIVHRANLMISGQKSANFDIKQQLESERKDGSLEGNVNKLTGAGLSPYWNHTLDIEYEWSGVRTRKIYHDKQQLTLPAHHLREASWRNELMHGGEATGLRVWNNGTYSLTRASGLQQSVRISDLPGPLAIDGAWNVEFQPGRGAPSNASLPKLVGWSDHQDMHIRHFSGTATMTTEFDFDMASLKHANEVWLDLGDVQVIAAVKLNGENLGTLWSAPYRINATTALKNGVNTLEVQVTNLWINRLIGDESQPDDCQWLENGALLAWPDWLRNGEPRPSGPRVAFTTWKHWKKDDVPPPSGLRGPVVLRYSKILPLTEN